MKTATVESVERQIVRHLIRELKETGYLPEAVWDGMEYVKTRTERQVLDAVFSVDSSTIHFDLGKGKNEHSHGVLIVDGNEFDVISDYHCGDKEFTAVLDRVFKWIERARS